MSNAPTPALIDMVATWPAGPMLLLAETPNLREVIALAEYLHHQHKITPLVLFTADAEFTQRLRPSTIMVSGMPAGVIANLVTLDQQGIPGRVCSTLDLPGSSELSIIELARCWLDSLDADTRSQVCVGILGSAALAHAAASLGVRVIQLSK